MKQIARKIVLLIGDWAGLYLALFIMLILRYGPDWEINWSTHVRPFSWVFPIWILVLFGMYLYETRFLKMNIETLRSIGTAIGISLIASITAFYAFPPGLISPRRNMVIFAAVYGLLLITWRWIFSWTTRNRIHTKLMFIGDGPETEELIEHFQKNPYLGFIPSGNLSHYPEDPEKLCTQIEKEGVKLLVVKTNKDDEKIQNLFPLLSSGVTVFDLEEFYERTFQKVSPEMLTDLWFVRNLENLNADVYKLIKRISDISIGFVGLVFSTAITPIVALAIKLDSKGPVVYKQTRTGKNGKPFTIYKFRTMQALSADGGAETSGAVWANDYDTRVTRVGNLLRKTRIDELPQLWNVFKGDMSFVGPRPERPEFIEDLSHKIPYYDMRHLIRPGITGWAQIKYEYGNSVEDARIKLQYDIYYAKHTSLALDIAIILKTIKTVVTRKGQ